MKKYRPHWVALQSQQDIVIYRNRKWAAFYTILLLLCSLFTLATLITVVWLDSLFRLFYVPYILILLGIAIILVCSFLIQCRVIWEIVTQWLLIKEPVLIVNHTGIWIGRLLGGFEETFVTWDKIGTIYSERIFFQVSISICPKDPDEYLCNYPRRKWPFFYFGSLNKSIVVQQSWIVQTVSELLTQIHLQYAEELLTYGIELKS